MAKKYEQGLSNDTRRLIRGTISAMCAEAIDDGIAVVSPVALPRGAKTLCCSPKADIRPLWKAKLACVTEGGGQKDGSGLLPFLFCSWHGRIFGLDKQRHCKWSDVNFANLKLAVVYSLSKAAEI